MGNMVFSQIFLSIEKEEAWLNEMSGKGLRFVKKRGLFSYEFEENTTEEIYRYYVDERLFVKDNPEFLQFLEELHIKLIQKQLGHYYFETTEENMQEHIYTDKDSRQRLYKRCILMCFAIAIMNIAIINNCAGPYLFNVSIPFVANSVLLAWMLLMIVNYIRLIYLLNRNEPERKV